MKEPVGPPLANLSSVVSCELLSRMAGTEIAFLANVTFACQDVSAVPMDVGVWWRSTAVSPVWCLAPASGDLLNSACSTTTDCYAHVEQGSDRKAEIRVGSRAARVGDQPGRTEGLILVTGYVNLEATRYQMR